MFLFPPQIQFKGWILRIGIQRSIIKISRRSLASEEGILSGRPGQDGRTRHVLWKLLESNKMNGICIISRIYLPMYIVRINIYVKTTTNRVCLVIIQHYIVFKHCLVCKRFEFSIIFPLQLSCLVGFCRDYRTLSSVSGARSWSGS